MPQADVAVVVKDNKTASITPFPKQYKARAYRACLVTKTGATKYNFKRWISGENWSFTPTGTAILELDDDPNVDTPPSNGTFTKVLLCNVTDLYNDSDKTKIYTAQQIPAIVFNSNGATSGNRYVNIGEGVYAGTQLVLTNDVYVKIEINQFTGRVSYGED
jgi:hypothetical protein